MMTYLSLNTSPGGAGIIVISSYIVLNYNELELLTQNRFRMIRTIFLRVRTCARVRKKTKSGWTLVFFILQNFFIFKTIKDRHLFLNR